MRLLPSSFVSVLLAIAFALGGFVPEKAAAQTINSNEFITLPAGTNLALLYYLNETLGSYNVDRGPTFKSNTGLDVNLGVARYVHYFQVGNYTAALQLLQAFGGETGGQIAGNKLNDATGAGDTTLSAVFWPYSDTASKTYVGIAGYVNVPDGSYNKLQSLNLGDDRYSEIIQLGINKGLGDHFSADLALDGTFYGDSFNAAAGGKLTQDPSFRVQTWLSYNVTAYANISVGFTGQYGGKEYASGFYTGAKTDFDRIKFGGSMFLSPTWQLLADVEHDVHAAGGFREDIGATVRLLKVF